MGRMQKETPEGLRGTGRKRVPTVTRNTPRPNNGEPGAPGQGTGRPVWLLIELAVIHARSGPCQEMLLSGSDIWLALTVTQTGRLKGDPDKAGVGGPGPARHLSCPIQPPGPASPAPVPSKRF
ncbi:hypothetical protein AAFF_G00146700 [Aldrovandia affinis]|uniref:Uncharacterized protein n=1 Tax=Aldrovandia affinis TaxID=143900 RepID=A0AAD7RPT1_9TELE|nr:hypothetical protein AAFF_G00146700 [Aldrovandia affinis]